jgi:hypothetical protein
MDLPSSQAVGQVGVSRGREVKNPICNNIVVLIH